jgi:D-sedoheptulose 7-phosphate isomerase
LILNQETEIQPAHSRTEKSMKTTAFVQTQLIQMAKNLANLTHQAEAIATVAEWMVQRIRLGGKILFCGNGGSAADAQHLAAELMGRFLKDRLPLPAIALNTNNSVITALGNDYGFADIFSRQIQGIAGDKDMLIALSTSGNSQNIINALGSAREVGAVTVGLSGASGGEMREACDLCICVPSSSTPRIQEMHIAIGHLLCELVEEALS